ncbi:penicillin-binding protein activator [bacterium]|nr:penicillin-binding protein activator [bacterium]
MNAIFARQPFLKLFFFSMIPVFLFLNNGCAPRYLEKTPTAILRYPYIPVEKQELESYRAQISASPYSPGVDQAKFWIAQDAFNRLQWNQAQKQFSAVLKKYPNSSWAPAAGIMTARAQVKLKRNLAALAFLAKLEKNYPQQTAMQTAANQLVHKIINDELSLSELARVRVTYQKTPWAEQALFVIGKRNLDFGNPDQAIKFFEQFLKQYPLSAFVDVARELMEKAVRIVPVNRTRIGCLLPLSGSYAPYGKTIQNGLELALDEINRFRDENDYLKLAVVDTAGTTAGAVAGFKRLAETEKVIAIIGPALSESVKALVPELKRKKVTVLTTSAAEPGLAAHSPFLFRYMLTNQDQGEAMAEYVVLRKNLQKIGILNGEAAYDRSLAEAFSEKVKALGGEIVARLEYSRGATDFKTQMMALGGVDPGYLKDLIVRERKQMERIVEKISYTSQQYLVPKVIDPTPPATPVVLPEKRVAIIRFAEEGDRTVREGLGKLFTEKISYALAPRNGVEVLTQAKTFKGIKSIGLSTLGLGKYEWRKIGEALNADYLIVGSIRQVGEETVHLPGEPLPIRYTVKARLVHAASGAVKKSFKETWIKSIPPDKNVKDMEAIYLPVSARDAVLVASQLAFYDLKAAVFGSDAWLSRKFFRQAGRETDGAVLATGYWPDAPSKRNQEFVMRYENLYKVQPTVLAVQAYDALFLISHVLKQIVRPNANQEDFQRVLAAVKIFSGMTGRIRISPDGEIRREPIFLKIKNKKLKQVR